MSVQGNDVGQGPARVEIGTIHTEGPDSAWRSYLASVAPGLAVSLPIVKASACLALGAIGVAGAATGHDGTLLQEVIGAILTIAGMATGTQLYALKKAGG